MLTSDDGEVSRDSYPNLALEIKIATDRQRGRSSILVLCLICVVKARLAMRCDRSIPMRVASVQEPSRVADGGEMVEICRSSTVNDGDNLARK